MTWGRCCYTPGASSVPAGTTEFALWPRRRPSSRTSQAVCPSLKSQMYIFLGSGPGFLGECEPACRVQGPHHPWHSFYPSLKVTTVGPGLAGHGHWLAGPRGQDGGRWSQAWGPEKHGHGASVSSGLSVFLCPSGIIVGLMP